MTKKNETIIIVEPGKQDIFVTREFNAPRELVFKAFTDPKMLVEWLGPRDLSMRIEKLDSTSGGSYRFVHCNASGKEFGFNGVMHEVTAPERIIRTFEFEGLPERGHVSLETATFEALADGRTKVAFHFLFKSVADRDGMAGSGMERGVVDSHDRLEELLEKHSK